MFSKYRFLWSQIPRLKLNQNYRLPIYTIPSVSKLNRVPCLFGFSFFTWLGFKDEKLTAEDDLIKTIKHCVLFIQNTEYEKAEQLLHVALRQAQQIRHQLGITYIYDIMANLALEREQLKKAKDLFVSVTQRIMSNGAKEDDPRVVHISLKLARISHLSEDYKTAQIGFDWCLDKLKNAYDSNPTDDTRKLLALAEDWYGRLYLDCNNNEQALKLMVSSLERMKTVPDIEQEHIVIQLNDIATVCNKLDRVDDSATYLKEAIKLGETVNIEDLGAMYVNLGRIYIRKNLAEEARKSCGHGWKLGVTTKNTQIKDEAEACLKEIKIMLQ